MTEEFLWISPGFYVRLEMSLGKVQRWLQSAHVSTNVESSVWQDDVLSCCSAPTCGRSEDLGCQRAALVGTSLISVTKAVFVPRCAWKAMADFCHWIYAKSFVFYQFQNTVKLQYQNTYFINPVASYCRCLKLTYDPNIIKEPTLDYKSAVVCYSCIGS